MTSRRDGQANEAFFSCKHLRSSRLHADVADVVHTHQEEVNELCRYISWHKVV